MEHYNLLPDQEEIYPIKIMLLKDTSKPYNFRSPVKVNGIGDGGYFEIATN